MRDLSATLVLLFAANTAACARTPAPPVAETAPLAQAAAPVAAPQADRVLFDFRDPQTLMPAEVSEAEQKRIVPLVLEGSARDGAAVTAIVPGSFTGRGLVQQAVIVVPGGPSTTDPFPQAGTLAILQDGKVVARHTFAQDDARWQWPQKAADLDGDGVDELLLSGGYTQMGESGTALLVASAKDGRYASLQTLENVQHDDCAAHPDDPAKGRSEAAVLTLAGGKLVEARYVAPCGKPDADGNPTAPAVGDYRPQP